MFRTLRLARPALRLAIVRPIAVTQLSAARPFSAQFALQKKAAKGASKASKGSAKATKGKQQESEEPLAEEDPSVVLTALEKECNTTLELFKKRIAETKQGTSSPTVFDSLEVPTGHKETQPFTAVAQTTLKGRNLIITVFDPSNVKHVVSAVLASGLNMNPQEVPNFPQQLKVPLPPPTAEHRKEIAKELKKDFEHFKHSPAKHSLSSLRGNALKELKSYVKNDTVKKAEKEVEKLHKKFLDELQKQLKAAEKSVLG